MIQSYSPLPSNENVILASSTLLSFGMKITVAGNEERILLIASYDNLGKGASGAAVECMNLAIGAERTKGLVL
jgi:N-acetyl-gamma-glutamyl-phosphate reductase